MTERDESGLAVKLTDWKNEPTLLKLKQDHMDAKTAHDDQVLKINGWNDLMKVSGSAKPKTAKGRSQVQPKLVRRQAEWRYSALSEPFLGTSKLFQVKPTTFEDGAAARQNELVLNYQFRTKLNRVKFIDDFVRSTVDEGTSILQVGWLRRTTKIKKSVPVYTHYEIQSEEELGQFKQALELSQSDPRSFREQASPEIQEAVSFYNENGQPTIAQVTGSREATVDLVIENRPTVKIHNPANVVIDPSCEGDIDKAMYVIVSFETNEASLKAEGKKYKNLDKVNWEGNTVAVNPDHETKTPTDFNPADRLRKKVVAMEYWGFWDIHGDGTLHPIVATWIGDVLIRMELNPFPDQKLPFIVVPYLPVKRELYGEPDAELLGDNQKILGALARGMIDLLGRSANSQQGFAKGMLDPLNRRKFENGQDYEFNPNLSPTQGHIHHTYPELPQSALVMLNLQNQEAESLTGVKSFSGGVSGDSYGDVAAGIRGALDAASKREMAILRRLARGITELGQKIIAMNAVFLSEEEVIRITNEEYIDTASVSQADKADQSAKPGMGHNGGPALNDNFITIRREDLQGNFDLEVDISTAEVDDAQAKDLAFMLQTIGPKADWSLVSMILSEICRLKRMPELAHKLKTWQPQPDPLAKRMQEAEVAYKEAQVEELRSQIALNQAKAEQARAQAEQVNLNAVEQATGTSHARDMERQQGQAQGNKELQITKALTQARKEGEGKPDIEAAIGYNELSGNNPKLSQPDIPLSVDTAPAMSDLAPVEQNFVGDETQLDPAMVP